MRLILMLLLGLATSPLLAQEAVSDQLSKSQLEKWSTYYQSRASQYHLERVEENAQAVLVMEPDPVMRWTNLVVSPDITHGECFVWTHHGRPEAFVSLFSYNKNGARTVAHAWNTLSRHSLVASHDGNTFWAPANSGLDEMKPVPRAPGPAESRNRRLVQMRQLARSFAARSGGTDGNKELELRLLATPVYRFESESDESLDGALFAFVTGTDPEVLLLIEAAKTGDQSEWQYLLLRHSHLTLKVRYKDELIWESLRGSTDYSVPAIERPYRSQHGLDTQAMMLK